MTTLQPNAAQFRVTQRTGAADPADPTRADSTITTADGKQYKVTIEIHVNNEWKKVDSSKFTPEHHEIIAQRCHEIYQQITHDTGSARTLSIYFKRAQLQESWKSALIGSVISKYKEPTSCLSFQKIDYKTADSSELQTFDVEKDEFDTPTDAQRVEALARSLSALLTLFKHPEQFTATPAKIKRASQPATQNLSSVAQTLNVQEAGSQENRCATLSIATILLNRHKTLKAAADAYDIPLTNVGATDQITLSNGLIELAAQTIETEDTFAQEPHFSNIVAALEDAQQTVDEDDAVSQYATLIRRPGQMLDVPVFDALQWSGIPFITLVPNRARNDFVLGNVSGLIFFDAADHSLDTYDLSTICFVVRDGLHYQAIQMNGTPAQDAKLRSILKADMENTLGQIQSLFNDSRSIDAKAREFHNLVKSVVSQYPFDSRPRIVQMLTAANKVVSADLISKRNSDFIVEAFAAFSGPTVNLGD
ncbi:MAG TPA: hypothetical protein VHK67_07610 [Rhabdochlamydiaceae bacterium]|nr:hypothetical protein [Rhabdochlamydiaceae bacterium]